jgi:hypothetical protein
MLDVHPFGLLYIYDRDVIVIVIVMYIYDRGGHMQRGACPVFGRVAAKAESIAGHLHGHHQWKH